jgi:hypothetical protein
MISKTKGTEAPAPDATEAAESPERVLLRAVLEALDVPYPDAWADNGKRLELLRERALRASAFIETALDEPELTKSAAKCLRRKTAELTATYKTEGGAA